MQFLALSDAFLTLKHCFNLLHTMNKSNYMHIVPTFRQEIILPMSNTKPQCNFKDSYFRNISAAVDPIACSGKLKKSP